MFVLLIKYKSFLNIYSFCKKNYFEHKKYLLKLRCELNNLFLRVSETANLWYSLNQLFPKHNFLKKIYRGIYS